jgi:hypothetical protein
MIASASALMMPPSMATMRGVRRSSVSSRA